MPRCVAVQERRLFPVLPDVHEAAKKRLGERYGLLFFLSLVTGAVASLAAIALISLVDLVAHVLFDPTGPVRSADAYYRQAPWYFVLVMPALGGLLVGLIARHLAREVSYSGIPNLMATTTMGDGRIRYRVGPLKILAAGITLGSGGSGGKEGPIAYIGGALGSFIGQKLKLSPHDLKILLAAGASSGIAAVFNAPLGGVMFSVEMFLMEFSTRAFIPIVIATVLATVLTFTVLDREPLYGQPDFLMASPFELGLYLLLGLLAALVAYLFIQTLYGVDLLGGRFRGPRWLLPGLGGLMVGVIGVAFLWMTGDPYVLGAGVDTVRALLVGNVELQLVLVLLFAKMAATAFTYSTGGAAGLFGPSLFMGACLGGAFGVLVQHVTWFDVGPPSAYALVGMAAVFAGASRATFASILIAFEITGTYEAVLPLMFACVASDALSVAITRHTLYTRKLEKEGVRYQYDREVNPLETMLCGECATTNVFTLRSDETVEDARRRVQHNTHPGFPVMSAKTGRLVGIITRRDLQRVQAEGDGEKKVSSVMTRDPITVTSDDTLQTAFRRIADNDVGRLPVVSPRDPTRLVGIISRTDLLRAHERQRRRLLGEERLPLGP
jgi:chloride channel protein, CIC family